MEKDDVYWTAGDPENLTHTDPDSVMEELADGWDVGDEPETVELQKYVRMMVVPPWWVVDRLMEHMMEALGEEYGDPNGGGDEATPEMKALTEKFVDDFCKLFVPYMCDRSGPPIVINVAEWLAANGDGDAAETAARDMAQRLADFKDEFK
jgi:hypothetical protein